MKTTIFIISADCRDESFDTETSYCFQKRTMDAREPRIYLNKKATYIEDCGQYYSVELKNWYIDTEGNYANVSIERIKTLLEMQSKYLKFIQR